MSDITLTSSTRSSLLSLQKTARLSERTQNRLASGRTVNSVTDDAVAFFRNRSLSARVSDFEARRSDIDQAISAVNSTLQGLDSVDSLLRQSRGLIEAARSQTQSERANATLQFGTVLSQIFQLVEDTSYQGTNLLNGTNTELRVDFGIRTASSLIVQGVHLNKTEANAQALFTGNVVFSSQGGAIFSGVFTGGNGFTVIGSNNSNINLVNEAVRNINDAITRIRTVVASFGNNVAILQTRLDFTNSYTDELQKGSDALVQADINEEGANLVALQTRQQLGVQSLSLSGQQEQAILRLF